MDRLRGLFIIAILLLLLAACGGQSDDTAQVPTEFVLSTATDTPTPWPTDVPTWTLTPTETLTTTATVTETPTVTPSMTITDTPTPTLTFTVTATADTGAVSLLAVLAQQATILPQNIPPVTVVVSSGPAPISTQQPGLTTCGIQPAGGFSTVYANDGFVQQQLGCPAAYSTTISGASQIFERGVMIWLQGSPSSIYVLTMNGSFTRFDDNYDANVDPYSGGEVAPAGLQEPVRGFGKVWRSDPTIKSGLGWAINTETGTQATLQVFTNGRMVYLPTRGDILVMTENPGGASGTWISVPGTF